MQWQELWCSAQMWGCRPKRGAEAMAMALSLQLENASGPSGGVSYDFTKAFDLVPHDLLFAALQRRGCHWRIIRPLQHLYKHLHRVFRLRGSLSDWWDAANGLVQGCALSMVSLNSLVSVVLEANTMHCPQVVGRTYADDISGTMVATSTDDLLHQIRRFHRTVKTLGGTSFGEISTRKSFTFGHNALQGCLDPGYSQHHAFKLVGGSFVTPGASASDSQVEQGRLGKWAKTVVQMRHSPHPWRVKARMLLVTQTQATYAQGTHSFQLDLDLLKKVRSNVMRRLWSSDFYTVNPNVTFALLVPPHLDPLFGHIYQRFRTILRCMQEPSFAACLKSRFHFAAADLQEGPALRLRNFSRQGPFRPLVLQLMSGPVQPEQWAHDLRMAWRGELWARAARARPQHFAEQKIMDLGVLRRLLCGVDDRGT